MTTTDTPLCAATIEGEPCPRGGWQGGVKVGPDGQEVDYYSSNRAGVIGQMNREGITTALFGIGHATALYAGHGCEAVQVVSTINELPKAVERLVAEAIKRTAAQGQRNLRVHHEQGDSMTWSELGRLIGEMFNSIEQPRFRKIERNDIVLGVIVLAVGVVSVGFMVAGFNAMLDAINQGG